MYNILIVDITDYKIELSELFQQNGYNVIICESAFDAMAKLKAFDFNLIISEIELPGDNAFDLYNYINKHYPYIPIIMTTEKNIDVFFDRIFQEAIGNVLCKPVKNNEILNLAEKLITKKNIFGLKNHMKDIVETKKIRINASTQIEKAINLTFKQIVAWGFHIEKKMIFTLILNELIINAVYHSYGYTKEKENRIPIILKEEEFVDIFFAKNQNSYGISINDYKGKLSKIRILECINNVIEQQQLILRASETGEDISDKISVSGRGIDLIRKLAGEYYFIIKKDFRTEIILLYDLNSSNENKEFHSLKIIEDINI